MEAPTDDVSQDQEQRHFGAHLVAVARVSAFLMVVKLGSAALIGAAYGAGLHLEMRHKVLPALIFEIDREHFVRIVGWSSIATASAAVAGLVAFGLRSKSIVRCVGWTAGLLSTFELIAADAYMQWQYGPRLMPIHLVVATAVCAVGVVIAFGYLGRAAVHFMSGFRRSLVADHPENLRLGAVTSARS